MKKFFNILSIILFAVVSLFCLLIIFDDNAKVMHQIFAFLTVIFSLFLLPTVRQRITPLLPKFKAWQLSLIAFALSFCSFVIAVPPPSEEYKAKLAQQEAEEKRLAEEAEKARIAQEEADRLAREAEEKRLAAEKAKAEQAERERQAEIARQEKLAKKQAELDETSKNINNLISNSIATNTIPTVVIPTSTPVKAVEAPKNGCKIVGVHDGDTATCLQNKTQIKIRLNQIDAPEIGQDFGNASKKALSDMIFGKYVELKTNGTDKYGRTIAEIFHENQNINKQMVAQGMAWAYREYMTDNEYLTLEDNARRAGIGLWSQPNPIYPSDFRRAKRGEQSSPVQTQQINQTQNKSDLVKSGGSCGSKRYCKQMTSCKEAKHYLNVCGVSRLDKDGDGVPCESLCK